MKKIGWIVIGVVILVQVYLLIGHFQNSGGETYYVELNKVFNEFEMKKELERDLKQKTFSREKKVDSLGMQLQMMNERWERDTTNATLRDSIRVLWNYYRTLSSEYKETKESLTMQYDTQIQNQLSQYLKDFGKQNGYSLLLGSMDNSVVLHSEKSKNVTEQAIRFVNTAYNDE